MAGWTGRRIGIGRALIGAHGIGLFAALTPLAGLLPPALILPALIVANLGTGFMAPIYGVNEVTLRQSLVEDRLLGRMAATSAFLFNGVMPIGAVAGGALAAVIGLQATLFLWAGGVLAGVMWFLPRRMRELR